MMKRKLLLLVALIACVGIYAQSVDEVTLVVNGSGTTKEDAVHTALRGAIEQAFGVFVSANTSIVNDELVKDEIATVTSGNVKSFTELESVTLPNGNFAVTLQAVVSTQKLAAYAKSKGSSCEFAGATFGANLKLLKLNQINTEKAFDNLMIQLETLAPYIFDYNLELGQPSQHGENGVLPITLKIVSNENTIAFTQLLKTTMQALALNEQQISEAQALGGRTFSTYLAETSDIPQSYTKKSGTIRFDFYSAFPVERLNEIIEEARAGYVITSDMAHKFTIEEEKTECRDVVFDIVYGDVKGPRGEWYPYGLRLCAGYCRYGSQAIYIPKWEKEEKQEVENPSKNKKNNKKKQEVLEEIPEVPKHQPVEINTIKTDLLMPLEDLMNISKFEVEKVTWLEYLIECVKEHPEKRQYYEKLISYYFDNGNFEDLTTLLMTNAENGPVNDLYYRTLCRYADSKNLKNFLKWSIEKYPEDMFYIKQYLWYSDDKEKVELIKWGIENYPENSFYINELINFNPKEFMQLLLWGVEENLLNNFYSEDLISKYISRFAYNPELESAIDDVITHNSHPVFHYIKGRFFMYRFGDGKAKAIEVFKVVVKLDPNYAYAYDGLGKAYLSERRYAEAVQAYEKLRTLDDGSDPNIRICWSHGLYRGYTYIGNLEKAKEFKDIYYKAESELRTNPF